MTTRADLDREHSERTAELMHRYKDKLAEIGKIHPTNADFGEYGDTLTSDQKLAKVRQWKLSMSEDAREDTMQRFHEEVDDYVSKVERLRGDLKRKLFKVDNYQELAALASASHDALATMVSMAADQGDGELARRIFAVAEYRGGMEGLMSQALAVVGPETRELYEEYRSLPTSEELETKANNVEAIVQPMDVDQVTHLRAAG